MSRARRIPENTAAYSRWLADQIEARASGITLSAEAAMFVGMALRGYAERLDNAAGLKLKFTVTATDTFQHDEVIATAASATVAWAAFQAAIPTRPNALQVRLLEGSRVVGESPAPALAAEPPPPTRIRRSPAV